MLPRPPSSEPHARPASSSGRLVEEKDPDEIRSDERPEDWHRAAEREHEESRQTMSQGGGYKIGGMDLPEEEEENEAHRKHK